MELNGITSIPASRAGVWIALNDPLVLARCVSGSDSFEQIGPHAYSAIASVKLGPVRSRIDVNITVTRTEPPHRATIVIHAKGKIGSVEAVVTLVLEEIDCGTNLHYNAQVNFGGQFGHFAKRWGRDAVEELVGEFFQRFAAAVPREDAAPHDVPTAAYVTPLPIPSASVPMPALRKKALWIGIGAAAGAAVTTVAAILLTRRGSR